METIINDVPLTSSENATVITNIEECLEQECIDKPENETVSDNLPAINTDNLPITPLLSKRWLNNEAESCEGASATFPKSEDDSIGTSKNLDSIGLPNTDNLLDIAAVPKTALLGKEQAKKRLHAFSLTKINYNLSPVKKKNIKLTRTKQLSSEGTDDTFSENGEKTDDKFIIKKPPRKSVNPNEKAKAVIEEIEEIKKTENAYYEALEQELLETKSKRSRSRSKERSYQHVKLEKKKSRSSDVSNSKQRKKWERIKYPENWTDFKNSGYNFEMLAEMKDKDYKDNECSDFRRQFLFQTPSLPLNQLTVKCVSGKEREVPAEFIRFTRKKPRISYSIRGKLPNDCFLRKSLLQYVPKSYRENVKKIIFKTTSISNLESPSKATSRKWFPKAILNKLDGSPECKVLENSLGLSFLQNYSDEEEQEKESNIDEQNINKKSTEPDKNDNKKTKEKSNKSKRRHSKPDSEVDNEKENEKKKSKTKKHKKKEKKKHKLKLKKQKKHKKKKNKSGKKERLKDVSKKQNKEDHLNDSLPDKELTEDLDHKNSEWSKSKNEVGGEPENQKSKNKHIYNDNKKDKDKPKTYEKKKIKDKKENRSSSRDKVQKDDKHEAESDLHKNHDFIKKDSRRSISPSYKGRKGDGQKHSLKNSEVEEKSHATEKKVKRQRTESPKKEQEVRKVKCVAEKEFGTPDTEEYYSNWECDIDLATSLMKGPPEILNQSSSLNQSWQSEDEPIETSDLNLSDIPLVKSPYRNDADFVSEHVGRDDRWMYKRNNSRRSSDKLLSPLRGSLPESARGRHLDSFPISPKLNNSSPLMRRSLSPREFSPFANRCLDERRRSNRSPEMPLNIRNVRNTYSRNMWEEERFNPVKYNRSSSPINDTKVYSLYGENSWERDDYLTIKTEEMKLEEERRTLIAERRQLEIERRQLEEMERQRYYSRLTEYSDDRRHFEDRKQEHFKSSDDENSRYRTHRDFREKRDHLKETEVFSPRRLSKDNQQTRRRSLESREKARGNFNWEEGVEGKRSERYIDKVEEQETSKKKQKSKWQTVEAHKNEGRDSIIKISEEKLHNKDKKNIQKNRWESSEDEIIIDRHEDSSLKESKRIINEDSRKSKDLKTKTNIEISKDLKFKDDNRQKSLTDNLDLSSRKSFNTQKPEKLEDEYEKFMQALGSEISTTEEISEKSFKQKKQKSKLVEKRTSHKHYSKDSSSASSDEEFEKPAKKQVKKRKTKKKVSSSSSSSSYSSSWSDSDSSSYSSSTSSSSNSSDGRHKNRKLEKEKINTDKNKEETCDITQTKLDTNINPQDSSLINLDSTSTRKNETITNVEEPTSKVHLDVTPENILESISPNKMKNLNIINLSAPEFSLGEIPLPNILKSTSSEAPLPVPSPKLPLTPLPINPDCVVPKIEPVSPLLSATVAPVPPVTSLSITASVELTNTFSDIVIKEEPVALDEIKTLEDDTNETELEETATENISSLKRNLVPIKFLTAELKKHSGESRNLENVDPKDVSKPATFNSTCSVKSSTPVTKVEGEIIPLANRKRYFAMSTIVLPSKRALLSDDDNDSTDFTDKFIKKDEKGENLDEVSTSDNMSLDWKTATRNIEKHIDQKSRKRSRSISPKRRRDLFRRSGRRDSRSPSREERDTYRSYRSERDKSPRRGGRRETPPKRYHDDSFDRSLSPRRRSERRDYRSVSPRDRGLKKRHRSRSPRHGSSKEFSPKRYRHKDDPLFRESRIEPIQETLQRLAGVDIKPSPVSSPLHGFKRSVADSTISDDQLIQSNTEEHVESPGYNSEYYKNLPLESPSPKRMSLDERISQALGLQAAQQPKPITTTYSENCDYDTQYFDHYDQYYEDYQQKQTFNAANGYSQNRRRGASNLKVLQVGNVLEVVPTEDLTQQKPPPPPVQQNKVTNSTQKIVQVGNMLQIVPTTELPSVISPPKPTTPKAAPAKLTPPKSTPPKPTPPKPTPPKPTPLIHTPPIPSSPLPIVVSKEILNAEALIKQKNEIRAERIKRKQERDKKRKEKERKRKEREKRKQLKTKLQTEAMIKQALIKETEEDNAEVDNLQLTQQWPPIPQIVFNSSHKPTAKGILCLGGSDHSSKNEDGEVKMKSVKFSDGVIPGEGTSPSGGEELSSPPPTTKKLPKEKRYIKTKIPKKPKKKKVKVKVIRQQQPQDDDDDDEDDNLPPPPPPPGSPPPHIFPARIKQPVINNIHPNIIVSIPNPPTIQPTDTSYPPPPVFRPQPPIMMPPHHGHHHGPPHLPPQGHHHQPPHHHHHHHPPPPPPPTHHGGFNPPTIIIPPVIQLPSIGPHKHRPQHGGHHHHSHHGGHGHSHEGHHHHHHHHGGHH